jgi:L-lactate dehydrogenase complex protein LldF
MMKPAPIQFEQNVRRALGNAGLQRAMARAKSGFIDKRRAAVSALPEFEALREQAAAIKAHTLENLADYLERFERQVHATGGRVHWARTPEEACEAVLAICRESGARTVTKGKTMAGEEIGVNQALSEAGIEPVETDLGEYIIQLAGERPSHIIAPAVHKTREEVSELFHHHHQPLGFNEKLREIPELVDQARKVLRSRFLHADVGITGANFLVAETGSSVIVTNEGNGDLTATLPRVHIVIAGIEKIVPTLADTAVLLRVLARSATGQELSAYTTFSTGPRRDGDLDGPEEFHVVLIDNGRIDMLGNEFRDMLRCIRCGACLNHCPVYGAIGGHAYGSVYPGPMGAILTPAIAGLEESRDLPQACTLNGRCNSVCPVKIPLTSLLRALRSRQWDLKLVTQRSRYVLRVWAFVAKRPRLYHWMARLGIGLLGRIARRKGSFTALPFAGAWTGARDFPAPQGVTFQHAWKKQKLP